MEMDTMDGTAALVAGVSEQQLDAKGPEVASKPVINVTGSNWLGIVPLNGKWRVNGSDRLQWQLEALRNDGRYKAKKWHVESAWLLVSIRQLCGPVDPDALRAIETWPAIYPSRRQMS